MNKVFLIGRLTRDPELRYTGNNTAVASFTIAVNRTYTNQAGEREADFIPVVVWRADSVEFIGSKRDNNQANNNYSSQPSYNDAPSSEPTPYDFKDEPSSNNGTDISNNPYADFGASIEIDDSELPF